MKDENLGTVMLGFIIAIMGLGIEFLMKLIGCPMYWHILPIMVASVSSLVLLRVIKEEKKKALIWVILYCPFMCLTLHLGAMAIFI